MSDCCACALLVIADVPNSSVRIAMIIAITILFPFIFYAPTPFGVSPLYEALQEARSLPSYAKTGLSG